MMASLEPLFQLPGISVVIYSKLDGNKPCLVVRDAKARSTIRFDRSEDLMENETIDLPLAPKKPYTPPQLHELTGSRANGKLFTYGVESGPMYAPS